MNQTNDDLQRRVALLEDQVQGLARELSNERARSARSGRRERWVRIAFWIAVGVAYVIYLQRVTNIV